MDKMLHIAAKRGKSRSDVFRKYTVCIRLRNHKPLYVINNISKVNPGHTF